MHVIGRSIPRVDGGEKVTGRARYTADLALPGMLHGAILRSTLPHARLRRIDASRALTIPGVVAVLTGNDVADLDPFIGHVIRDRPLIALDRVRYVGEPVAAVAALDELTAREAAALIDVEYDELPPVLDVEGALRADSSNVHEHPQEHNICFHRRVERGDPEAGFAQAAQVFEHRFSFPSVYQYTMEPHGAIAAIDGTKITIWTSAQHPFLVRAEVAAIFRKALDDVRVIVPYVGGGFGSKSYTKIEPLVVALARKAGRPVRMAQTVTESCLISRRHAATVILRTGVDAQGHLIARTCTIWLDTGAYADNGPRVAAKAAVRVLGGYRCPHVRADAYAVYTNTSPAGSFRSIGAPQAIWANESQLDIIAEALGIDPLELRLRNLLVRGEQVLDFDRPLDVDLSAGLRRVADGIDWARPRSPHRGRGVALGLSDSGADAVATAIVRLHNDGSATVHESSTEIGQGVRTILAQIAAEELGLPVERIGVVASDTDSTPYDRSTGASRSTTVMGHAVQRACADLRDQIAVLASPRLGAQAAQVQCADGYAQVGDQRIAFGALIREHFRIRGGELIGRGYVWPEGDLARQPLVWEAGWGAAEVDLDEETGTLHLRRYVSAADVGIAINPKLAEGQDEGAAMMGIGHTFYEALQYEAGQLLNGNLIDYRVPLMDDLPEEYDAVLVEDRNGPGVYGAKGMGEGAINPVAPAVGSALARACGVRLFDLPLTPERVWRALRGRRLQAAGVR